MPRQARFPSRWTGLALAAGLCVAGVTTPFLAHAPADQATRAAPAPLRAGEEPRRDLGEDERRGGHTLARHVGRSDEELAERLRREPRISAASTYFSRAVAERVVGSTLRTWASRVRSWTGRRGSRPNLALDYRGSRAEPVGRVLERGDSRAWPAHDAVVVLRWDADRGNYFVLTSYPEIGR